MTIGQRHPSVHLTPVCEIKVPVVAQSLTPRASRSVLQLAALLGVSLQAEDPRRLISRAPDLSLFALSWRTMAPFLCPEAVWTGVRSSPLDNPPMYFLFLSVCVCVFSPVLLLLLLLCLLDGKLSVCVTVSALSCRLKTEHRALTGDRGEEVALKTANASGTYTGTMGE